MHTTSNLKSRSTLVMEKLKICMLRPAASPPDTDIFPTVIHGIPWQGAPQDQRVVEEEGLRKEVALERSSAGG